MQNDGLEYYNIHKPYPLDIVSTSGSFWLAMINADGTKYLAGTKFDHYPTWKELIDEAIQYCKDNSIPLPILAETGHFRHGDYGRWLPMIEHGVNYISIVALETFKKKTQK